MSVRPHIVTAVLRCEALAETSQDALEAVLESLLTFCTAHAMDPEPDQLWEVQGANFKCGSEHAFVKFQDGAATMVGAPPTPAETDEPQATSEADQADAAH